jgi:nicotinamidase/pyrazinamidase
MTSALLIIDVQNDFCPGGALAVRGGDQVVPVINGLAPRYDVVVATQDWHPREHGSFAANHPGAMPGETIDLQGVEQTLWPVHCVQGTPGAAFHPDLDLRPVDAVFRKGTDPAVDSYSAFYDNARLLDLGLSGFLRARGVRGVHVAGLATDYCVRFSALDGLSEGFDVGLIVDACRAVDLTPGDGARALREMEAKGVRLLGADDVSASGPHSVQSTIPSPVQDGASSGEDV